MIGQGLYLTIRSVQELDTPMRSEEPTQDDVARMLDEVKQQLSEAHRQQAATANVLKVISRSAFDLQVVLDTLVESAARLCEAESAAIHRPKDGRYPYVASYGYSPEYDKFMRAHPIVPSRGTVLGRAVLEGSVVHVADILADPNYTFSEAQKMAGFRTALGVPLMREGTPIGVIILTRNIVRPFAQKQIELVTTYADQAVIAIENTRLFEAEQARKRELQESLEYQTATAEVLGVLSRSPTDVQPVFEAIAKSAANLCSASDAIVLRVDGDVLRLGAHCGSIPIGDAIPLRRGTVGGRSVIDRRVIHVEDLRAEEVEYPEGSAFAKQLGHRTTLSVPLLREGVAIGNIQVRRDEVQPFDDKQIALLQIFADQAVIAIENARLFDEVQTRTKELQESLDRQTATSEVLGVISRSPNEVQPVLDTIVATAQRLCQAERAIIWRLEGETFRAVAHHGLREGSVESILSARMPLGRGSMSGRATLARRAVQVEDVATDPELLSHAFNRAGNVHTVLAVPLLLKGEPIGVIALARTRVARFDDKQVALVESFADQAVIAMENARLFEAEQASKRELTEALEQQTATADVLKVISRSALDVQKVLDALVESAARLCNAYDAAIFQLFGNSLRLVAHRGQIPLGGPVGQYTVPLVRERMYACAVIDRR